MSKFSRRQLLAGGVGLALTTSLPHRPSWAANANDEINVGFISCGGRAGQLMGKFAEVPGVNIAGLCDPDEKRLGLAKERFPKAQGWTDLRELIASDSLDAVVVATCNHWHCLAAIWAMEAGKDVYVEKPLSHSQWEGRQTVAATKKYGRICAIGTQQRSDPMQTEIKKFLHEDKTLGEIQSARVNRYGVRPSIGRRETPLPIEKDVAYDLWLGPAQDEPIYREKLHYDWHWDWNTGSGEMGNWGVHVLDDVRNTVFRDRVVLPKKIVGGGGRVALGDAGNTPNVHFAYFDTGSIPVVIGLSNLPGKPGEKKSPSHPGPASGYIAYCEGGRYEGQRGKGAAFDRDGKKIREFSGDRGDGSKEKGRKGEGSHQANFIDALRRRDASVLNAPVDVGNDSTGWCNLANIAFRAGKDFQRGDARGVGVDIWDSLIDEIDEHLSDHSIPIESSQIKLSAVLDIDPKTEEFVGDNAGTANQFLKRRYRSGFEVPELV